MRFVKVKDPYHSPEWMILITSIFELTEWYEFQTIVTSAVIDVWQNVNAGKPATTAIGHLYETRKKFGLPTPGALGMAEYLSEVVFRQKVEMLEDVGHILISETGGYSHGIGGYYKVLETVDRKPMDWPTPPEGEVRYLQWGDDMHWYAKIGDRDVVVDGEQKWNTKAEAEKAVAIFTSSMEVL